MDPITLGLIGMGVGGLVKAGTGAYAAMVLAVVDDEGTMSN